MLLISLWRKFGALRIIWALICVFVKIGVFSLLKLFGVRKVWSDFFYFILFYFFKDSSSINCAQIFKATGMKGAVCIRNNGFKIYRILLSILKLLVNYIHVGESCKTHLGINIRTLIWLPILRRHIRLITINPWLLKRRITLMRIFTASNRTILFLFLQCPPYFLLNLLERISVKRIFLFKIKRGLLPSMHNTAA